MSTVSMGAAKPVPSLDAAVRRIDEISTLPDVATQVMRVAADNDSSAADLKGVMEHDVALSARILRCVNSSAYAVRMRITNLQHAIAYLGLKQIRNLAMTASVADLFKKDQTIKCYHRRGLWQHLVSVGICARLIAMRRKIADYEDAFLAGLMHDVGIVLEDQHLHQAFVRVIESLDGQRTLAETERGQLDFDHTMLGERVAEQWKFPEAVRSAIRYHHGSVCYRGPAVDVLRCVDVANLICTFRGISSVGMKLVKVCPAALEGLSLSNDDVVVIAEDLQDELTRNAGLFTL
jgi:HD-like signal output (HDOD) protein